MTGPRLEDSEPAYQVLRVIALRDGDILPGDVADEGFQVEEAEQILELFSKAGFLEKNGDAYSMDISSLKQKWVDLWNDEIGQEMDPSGKREQFLDKYFDLYISEVENSTIRDMLVDDFFQGMREFAERDDFTPDWVEIWLMTLKQNYETVQSPRELFQDAVDEME